ncbi:hypothetical protein [Victivallis sp. Marseille-Q1083]|uniref:hypothetical protein n=1 Tax=Victivallis sp. Marseille-Q1083 TaxID=2717288 RepID=UPI00158A87E6|nr:hypothetical protein [Victivallis sp. Marseille-Q1083]
MSNKWEFTLRAIGIICTFIFICISCIACFFFNNKIGNIEVNNIKIRVNLESLGISEFEMLYSDNVEDIKLMEEWLDSLRNDRGSFAYMYITFVPGEIELNFDNVNVSFGVDNLVINTKDNGKDLQSLKKMDELDFKMKERLKEIVKKEIKKRNYSFPYENNSYIFNKTKSD